MTNVHKQSFVLRHVRNINKAWKSQFSLSWGQFWTIFCGKHHTPHCVATRSCNLKQAAAWVERGHPLCVLWNLVLLLQKGFKRFNFFSFSWCCYLLIFFACLQPEPDWRMAQRCAWIPSHPGWRSWSSLSSTSSSIRGKPRQEDSCNKMAQVWISLLNISLLTPQCINACPALASNNLFCNPSLTLFKLCCLF